MTSDDGWSDSALRDVRSYTLTGGRTRPRHALNLTTCLITRPARQPAQRSPEIAELLGHCSHGPRCVAEIAAVMHQPAQVIKVLISDLLDADALALANPSAPVTDDAEVELLEALLHGLRRKV
ncbi:hypothetical protein AR457_40260 [Streptomyces agglomeratus]|uniref:DUF742 domain-containing protein n=1 Tax=Streptomyces agglomeratus TaxID=285458 RepID=UPI000852808C|nr:DUF742 domain-containing protein [Streptomyces agglomeratus]OEJ22119.1 hypothetical protein AR457_40260 [Streptomyces agglomeratus]OEJ36957.1 hypothetical protein BGK70_00915 [Streptomyces agglomeratus]